MSPLLKIQSVITVLCWLVFLHNSLNARQHWEFANYEKSEQVKKQTCLNTKHYCLVFQRTYHQNSFKHFLLTEWRLFQLTCGITIIDIAETEHTWVAVCKWHRIQLHVKNPANDIILQQDVLHTSVMWQQCQYLAPMPQYYDFIAYFHGLWPCDVLPHQH